MFNNDFFGMLATRQDMLDAAVDAIIALPDPTDAYEVAAAIKNVGLYEISSYEAEYIEDRVIGRIKVHEARYRNEVNDRL